MMSGRPWLCNETRRCGPPNRVAADRFWKRTGPAASAAARSATDVGSRRAGGRGTLGLDGTLWRVVGAPPPPSSGLSPVSAQDVLRRRDGRAWNRWIPYFSAPGHHLISQHYRSVTRQDVAVSLLSIASALAVEMCRSAQRRTLRLRNVSSHPLVPTHRPSTLPGPLTGSHRASMAAASSGDRAGRSGCDSSNSWRCRPARGSFGLRTKAHLADFLGP